jgi:hypothetical protein
LLTINLFSGIFGGNKWTFYFSIFILILLFGGVFDIADEENYRFSYNNISNDNILNKYNFFAAPGWYFCNYIAINLNLSYEYFRFIIGAISLFFVAKTITKYSANINITLILFIIFPFIIDNVQIRNFFATSIFLYSIRFLNEEKKYNIAFLILTILASSIHQTYLFFIPFIFFYRLSIQKIHKIIVILIVIFIIIIKTGTLLIIIQQYFDEIIVSKISIYLYNSGFGFVMLWLIQFCFVFITYKTAKIFNNNNNNNNRFKSFLNIVVKLNAYSLMITVPLVILDGTYFRVFRNLLVLNFIVNSYLFIVMSKHRFVFLLFLIILNITILFISVYTPLNIKYVVEPFFYNNLYLN